MNPFVLILAGPLLLGLANRASDLEPSLQFDRKAQVEQELRRQALEYLRDGSPDMTGDEAEELALWLDIRKTTVKIAPLDGMPIIVPNRDRFAMPHHAPGGRFPMPMVKPAPPATKPPAAELSD